jgi:hypothetical protein
MALSDNKIRKIKSSSKPDEKEFIYLSAQNIEIFEGALIGLDTSTGIVYPYNTNLKFVGVNDSYIKNPDTDTNRYSCKSNIGQIELMPYTGANYTDVGKRFYATDDNTITTNGNQNQYIGYCVEYDSLNGNALYIKIEVDYQTELISIDWISGRFYDFSSTVYCNGLAGYANPNGKITYTPIYIPNDITISKLHIRNTTLASGKVGKLAIYKHLNNKPTKKLFESSNIPLDTAAIRYVTCNLYVTKGWYWIAFTHNNTSTVTLEALTGYTLNLLGYSSAFAYIALASLTYQETFSFGVMPTTAIPVNTDAIIALNRIMIEVA